MWCPSLTSEGFLQSYLSQTQNNPRKQASIIILIAQIAGGEVIGLCFAMRGGMKNIVKSQRSETQALELES